MSAVPGNVDTDRQPPMTVPLRHFVLALAFLVAGSALGVGTALGRVSVLASLAHVHLLLAGRVCEEFARAVEPGDVVVPADEDRGIKVGPSGMEATLVTSPPTDAEHEPVRRGLKQGQFVPE